MFIMKKIKNEYNNRNKFIIVIIIIIVVVFMNPTSRSQSSPTSLA